MTRRNDGGDDDPSSDNQASRVAVPAAASGDASVSATERALAALVALAEPARRIVAFTGAGISTESGIPDYRGPNGVWATGDIPTIADFRDNAGTRRAYWDRRRTSYPELVATRPNDGHLALVALERVGLLLAVVTQNIDGLHQKAGNDPDRVIELHGTAHRVRCLDCERSWPAEVVQARLAAGELEPRCPVCGGPLRGATVLFGEPLPDEALRRATEVSADCDLMLVVGSSLVVNPAARLPVLAKRRGARLAIVNRTPTPLDALADVRVAGDAGPVLRVLATRLVGWSP
jgi:NAD-dependent deacetylase